MKATVTVELKPSVLDPQGKAIEHSLDRFAIPVDFAHYPDGYHMLLRDIQGEQVMGDILAWMGGAKGGLPSGFSSRIPPLSNP